MVLRVMGGAGEVVEISLCFAYEKQERGSGHECVKQGEEIRTSVSDGYVSIDDQMTQIQQGHARGTVKRMSPGEGNDQITQSTESAPFPGSIVTSKFFFLLMKAQHSCNIQKKMKIELC